MYLQGMTDKQTPKGIQDKKNLIENIAPFFIRVKKSDLGLPDPVNHDPIYLPMSQSQKAIYEHIEKKYIDSFEKESSAGGFTEKLKKAKLIRLMQCVTNPHLLNSALTSYYEEEGFSNDLNINDRDIISLIQAYDPQHEVPPKFVKAYELIQNIITNKGADGKVIIWSIFIQNIKDLKEYLNNMGVKSELLYGETPNENDETPENVKTREKIIEEFHRDECSYKVIIANPFAVGESISMHEACHNAIYLEKSFNAAMYMQSKDRIHRYGLGKSEIINYYHLLTEQSIDQTIHTRVLEKEQRMLDVIENEEIPLLSMNMDESDEYDNDLKAFIEDYHARKST
jgi:SNF2 family DNA or RNA helicase